METLDGYLTELSSASATPGGGSAAMIVAATGAALIAMVARISAANPKYAGQHEAAERIAARADVLRGSFLEARKRDEDAFARVVEAQRLPKDSDAAKEARGATLELALHGAASVPLELAQSALEALQLVNDALRIGNKNLVSDLGCAAEFSFAAVMGCGYSVRINHKYMKNQHSVSGQAAQLAQIEEAARAVLAQARRQVGGELD
ncbi:MAG: cyclodeaminase/cyclohydrolase family protein [Candidatus Eremiobacteraeota bacterium]|nr:cyclodeaminase/cyclohydrolase family protein [Candidatus Eremiobacteraeota bacterium]